MGHHGRCLIPSSSLLLVLSAIIPHSTSSSVLHISLFSSMNWLLDALHCVHHHPAIDSFPRAIAWKAKSPVRYMSMMCALIEQFYLNLYSNNPSLFTSMWRCHVATISRPLVSRVRIVRSINLPVSFRQIARPLLQMATKTASVVNAEHPNNTNGLITY